MISKEDFNKVWKDSTREGILNQYYYDYIELRKVYSIIKEVRKYINKQLKLAKRSKIFSYNMYINDMNTLLCLLDKVEENSK